MIKRYERIGIVTIDDVLPFITTERVKKEYFGIMINICSSRLNLFKEKGIKCVHCGIEGKYFAVESHKGKNQWHLNLYAINENGKEVLMTQDHIIPQSRCSNYEKKSLDNLQTMCTICNWKKQDKSMSDFLKENI